MPVGYIVGTNQDSQSMTVVYDLNNHKALDFLFETLNEAKDFMYYVGEQTDTDFLKLYNEDYEYLVELLLLFRYNV